MKVILGVISQNKLFYLLHFLVVVFAIFLLVVFSRADGFIWLNQVHTVFLRSFFENITLLGDGWFVIVTAIVLLFFKEYRFLACAILLGYVSSGLFSQILKNLISSPRPSVYFSLHKVRYFVDTFSSSRIGFSSFPSGHTASFFAFSTVVCLYIRKRGVCVVSILTSILVGYSRIYLAHHFLIDVCAGAVIGLVFGSLSILWMSNLMTLPAVRRWKKKLIVSNSQFRNPYFN